MIHTPTQCSHWHKLALHWHKFSHNYGALYFSEKLLILSLGKNSTIDQNNHKLGQSDVCFVGKMLLHIDFHNVM